MTINHSRITLTSEIKIAATADVKQPFIWNFGINFETRIKQKPLINNKKRPNVINVSGNVNKMRIGRITAFTKASKTAARNAVKKSSTWNSFVAFPTINIDIAKSRNFISKISIIKFPYFNLKIYVKKLESPFVCREILLYYYPVVYADSLCLHHEFYAKCCQCPRYHRFFPG